MVENLIIIDSNFILLPIQFKIDYLREISDFLIGKITFIIYQQILNELDAKKYRSPEKIRFRKQLDSGMTYLEHNKNNYNIVYDDAKKQDYETTDDFLIRKCVMLSQEQIEVYLATNDKELRKKATKKKISSFYLRQKKYIEVERV